MLRVAGAWIIGGVLLSVGLVVLLTEIDPLLLCFKQCRATEGWRELVGPVAFRFVSALFYIALGAAFLWPRGASGGAGRREEEQ